MIRTTCKHPRLLRMKLTKQRTQRPLFLMALDCFQRHNCGIFNEIVVDGALEEMDVAIIAATCEERVATMVGDAADGGVMAADGFVGFKR